MNGVSKDVLVVVQVGSILFAVFGGAVVVRCVGELVARLFTLLARRFRRPRISFQHAMSAYAKGRIERAHDILLQLLRRDPENYKATLAMWNVARDAGHPEQAQRALLRAIRREVKSGDRDQAVQHWLELCAHSVGEVPAEPGLLVRLGSLLEQANLRPEARRAFQRALDRSQGAEAASIASRIARAAVDLDREMAEEAAWRALGSEHLDLSDRLSLQALLRRLYPNADTCSPLDLDRASVAA